MNQNHSQASAALVRTEDDRTVIERAVRFLESGSHTTIARDTMANELRKLLATRINVDAQPVRGVDWFSKEAVIEMAFASGLGQSAMHPGHYPAYACFAEIVAQTALVAAAPAIAKSLPIAFNEFRLGGPEHTYYEPSYAGSDALISQGHKPYALVYLKDVLAAFSPLAFVTEALRALPVARNVFRHNDVTWTSYAPTYPGTADLLARGYKPDPLVYLKDVLAALGLPSALQSAPPSALESTDIRGPMTDAQRNDVRGYACTVHGGHLGRFDDIIREASAIGYRNGYHDFREPAAVVYHSDGFTGGVDCPECGVGTEHNPGCERSPEVLAAASAEGRPELSRGAARAPQLLTHLDYRAQGREEALAIILGQDAEDPFAECIRSSPSGDSGDYSTEWDENKLRELLHIGDSKYDAFGRAEAMYYEAQGHKSEAEREKLFVAQAPFYQPLHDFLSKHQAWDLMGDLKRAAGQAPQSAEVDVDALRSLPWEDQSTADPVEKARRVLGHLVTPDIVYFFDDGFPRKDAIKKGAQNVLAVLNAFTASTIVTDLVAG